jgi:hypothetical protein
MKFFSFHIHFSKIDDFRRFFIENRRFSTQKRVFRPFWYTSTPEKHIHNQKSTQNHSQWLMFLHEQKRKFWFVTNPSQNSRKYRYDIENTNTSLQQIHFSTPHQNHSQWLMFSNDTNRNFDFETNPRENILQKQTKISNQIFTRQTSPRTLRQIHFSKTLLLSFPVAYVFWSTFLRKFCCSTSNQIFASKTIILFSKTYIQNPFGYTNFNSSYHIPNSLLLSFPVAYVSPAPIPNTKKDLPSTVYIELSPRIRLHSNLRKFSGLPEFRFPSRSPAFSPRSLGCLLTLLPIPYTLRDVTWSSTPVRGR